VRALGVEAALRAGATAEEAAEAAPDGCEPTADLHASVEYRNQLARVLVARAIAEAADRNGG